MADIATIGFKAETRDLDEARKKLELLRAAAAATEKSVDDVSTSTGKSATEINRSISSVGNNARGAFSQLTTGAKSADGALSQVSSGASRTSLIFARFAGAAIAGAFVALGLAVRGVYNEMVKLDALALKTNESLMRLQQIQFAAGDKGISGQTFNTDVAALATKAADAMRTGEGELKELFEANNLKITDREGKLKSVNQLLTDAAYLMTLAGSELDKIKVAEMLGLSEEWVKVLGQGPEAFRASQEEALKTGNMIDSELIKRAADFDKAWSSAVNSFATRFKVAVAEAGGAVASLISSIDAAFASFRKFTNFSEENRKNLNFGKSGRLAISDQFLSDSDRAALNASNERRIERMREANRANAFNNIVPKEVLPVDDSPLAPVRPKGFGGPSLKFPKSGGGGKSPEAEEELTALQKISEAYKELSEPFNQANTAFTAAKTALENNLITNEQYVASLDKIKNAFMEAGGSSEQWAKLTMKNTEDVSKTMTDFAEKSLKKVGDQFVDMAFKGKINFGDLAKSIVKDLVKIMVQALIVKPLMASFGGFSFGNGGAFAAAANGAAFGGNTGVSMFANGGSFTNRVVNKPTPFKYGGSKLGIMGEAGPEAIMPLKRGNDGSLGVQMHSGGGRREAANTSVNVNNNYTIAGAVSSKDIHSQIKMSAEETVQEVKKQLVGWIQTQNSDGYLV